MAKFGPMSTKSNPPPRPDDPLSRRPAQRMADSGPSQRTRWLCAVFVGRRWEANSAKLGSNSVDLGSSSANFGPSLVNLDQPWPGHDQFRPDVDQIYPEFGHSGAGCEAER